jgi:hypothetical protein
MRDFFFSGFDGIVGGDEFWHDFCCLLKLAQKF